MTGPHTLPSVHFIGCGRVGKSLAKLLKNVATIHGIVNTTFESSQAAVQFIGQGKAYRTLESLPFADVLFITTPDDLIGEMAAALASHRLLKKNAIVVHCSGALCSDHLLSVKSCGALVASLHPIKSFADAEQAYQTFSGTYCSLEGDQQAIRVLKKLFEPIGAVVFPLQKKQKALYHAACVMANNYCTSLHAQASHCFEGAGLSNETAKAITSRLMLDAIQNIGQLTYQEALTGPLQRGDLKTIQNHLAALAPDPLSRQVYVSLGLAALSLTSHADLFASTLKTE